VPDTARCWFDRLLLPRRHAADHRPVVEPSTLAGVSNLRRQRGRKLLRMNNRTLRWQCERPACGPRLATPVWATSSKRHLTIRARPQMSPDGKANH
jgi:hypothetical protein